MLGVFLAFCSFTAALDLDPYHVTPFDIVDLSFVTPLGLPPLGASPPQFGTSIGPGGINATVLLAPSHDEIACQSWDDPVRSSLFT